MDLVNNMCKEKKKCTVFFFIYFIVKSILESNVHQTKICDSIFYW